MSKLEVVTAITNPILQQFHRTKDPSLAMVDRGFTLFDMIKALQVISVHLADPRQTGDGNAYGFKPDWDSFAETALALNQPNLDAEINACTKPMPKPSPALVGLVSRLRKVAKPIPRGTPEK